MGFGDFLMQKVGAVLVVFLRRWR